MSRYADIVLPLWQPLYTFEVADDTIAEGDAVAVQFGPKAIYTGIVWRIHDRRPDTTRNIKPTGRRLYDRPLLSPRQMQFWEWIADYYMCTLGEVMRFAIPSMAKPKGSTDEEFSRMEFKPRTELFAVAAQRPTDEELACLRRRAPKQAELLEKVTAAGELPRRQCSDAALAALCRKGFLQIVEREAKPQCPHCSDTALPDLTPAQQQAASEIRTHWNTTPTVLLQGVSGSGKTEIYMHLAREVLDAGGDVLMLVPEIALTTQLTSRIRAIFGERVTAYHSKLTAKQRMEIYMRLNASQGGSFIVGPRSALFLPPDNLRLVIVDEEHDAGYRQTEPPPRYNGRDAALMLARICGARTLLGSATPSLESYVRATTGKYGYVRLEERFGGGRPSQIIISDTMRAVKRGERRSHFNKILIDSIADRLDRGEQVLLFQNRRGYSPYMACGHCGWTPRCPVCNVTMSLHAGSRLVCHYCGRSEPQQHRCPACNNGTIVPMGFGTEKVEAEIANLFPEARVVRLDRDSAPSQTAYERIIGSFERGEADIMVGTQIITKGLDFSRVTLTAVLNADNLLNAPDFRAAERAFQTIMQFAGRGGRRNRPAEVIIQTSEPEHPLLQQLSRGDYEAMARGQLAERHTFSYPPYSRIIAITLRHPEAEIVHRAAAELASALRSRFARRLLGPTMPPNDRIRGVCTVGMMLKIESGASLNRARMLVREIADGLMLQPQYKKLSILFNVDI